MPLFSISDISLNYGSLDVLSHVSARLDAGDRVGLVGPNGTGKTTLLRIIAGEERPNGGQVAVASGSKLGYVPQIPRVEAGRTVREEVLSGIAHLADMEAEIERTAHDLTEAAGDDVRRISARYDELTRRFEAEGGYRYRAEAEQILAGLRLPERLWGQPVEGLSGGEQSRIALARVLLLHPDVLLLDEPTNHLDIAGIAWLESFLQRWPGAIVVVSHDRFFLDNVATEIWEIRGRKLVSYRGNYSHFVAVRAERMAGQREQYERQQSHIAKEEELIRRYKEGQRAKWAIGRQKQLSHIERIERPQDDAAVAIKLGAVTRTGRVVVGLDDLVITQPGNSGRELLHFPKRTEVERGERIAIVGGNGTGKTTLLRAIMGEREPGSGTIKLGANVRPSYYRQGTEHLDDRRSVMEELLATRNLPNQEARDLLAMFLFRGDTVDQKVATLSGGQRSRLALAKLTADDVNVLLLDEPTNHLDIASREALEAVLAQYSGTILFVTHDRFLIRSIATKTWLVHDDRVYVLDGPATELPDRLTQAPASVPRPAAPAGTPPRIDRQAERDLQRRAREVEQLETRVSEMETKLEQIAADLESASAAHDPARSGELGAAYAAVEQQLRDLMAAWEQAAEAVELAAQGRPG